MRDVEILAPAGSPEGLVAAVRCGANAVYFGGRSFNARRSAKNFSREEITDAVKYCRARGVKAYLALNTIVFDGELDMLSDEVRLACDAGVDALIIQDLAVLSVVKRSCMGLKLFASTQMAAHNTDGVRELEALGFSRAILARELSAREISEISKNTVMELECFVHGALCMSVSGQCYLSAMLGGRSGNRGMCAQPCRLPMRAEKNERALSLKDLSLVKRIPELIEAGITSLKIEGRMKRPEYVAAAVLACKKVINGEEPDIELLESVFSRSGFTDAYFDGKPGLQMFGARTRDDVIAASPKLLGGIAAKYKDETPLVPVNFLLKLRSGEPAALTVSDPDGNKAKTAGDIPEQAKTSPLNVEKAQILLSKTGGTPFYTNELELETDGELMLPAAGINAMRRSALEALLKMRESVKPHDFADSGEALDIAPYKAQGEPGLRVRVSSPTQLSEELFAQSELVIIPIKEILKLGKDFLAEHKNKIVVELPRAAFGGYEKLDKQLVAARNAGITNAAAGNIGAVAAAKRHGFSPHGDFSLNAANSLAITQYESQGLKSITVSIELKAGQISQLGGKIPRGILAYGYLPLMLMRACPISACKSCINPEITDRLGNKFTLFCKNGVPELLNCVPLFLAHRLGGFRNIDFIVLYFTRETPAECMDILRLFKLREKMPGQLTHGLYYRGVG